MQTAVQGSVLNNSYESYQSQSSNNDLSASDKNVFSQASHQSDEDAFIYNKSVIRLQGKNIPIIEQPA